MTAPFVVFNCPTLGEDSYILGEIAIWLELHQTYRHIRKEKFDYLEKCAASRS